MPLVADLVGATGVGPPDCIGDRDRLSRTVEPAEHFQFPMCRSGDCLERGKPHEHVGVAVNDHEAPTLEITQLTDAFTDLFDAWQAAVQVGTEVARGSSQ